MVCRRVVLSVEVDSYRLGVLIRAAVGEKAEIEVLLARRVHTKVSMVSLDSCIRKSNVRPLEVGQDLPWFCSQLLVPLFRSPSQGAQIKVP